MADETKPITQSRTIWINAAIAAVIAAAPILSIPADIIPTAATPLAIGMAVLNIALRLMSKKKLIGI